MVNRSRREAPLDRESSEEERKPTVSPVNEQQTSLVVNPKAIFGSDQPLPQHLTDILEKWHKEKGTKRPPCNTQRPAKQMEWKTFDRQGNHVNLSAYAIIKPTAYNVLVLHTAEGPEKIVSSYFPFGTGHGTYLIGWSGVHDGWDPTICAVRMFSNNLDDILYKPEVWPAFEVLEKRHNKTQAPTSRASEKRRSLPGGSQMQIPQRRPQRKSLSGPPVATHDHRANNAHETSSSSSSAEGESDEEDDTSGSSESSEDEEDEEPEPTPVSKRRRLNEPGVPALQDAKVVFKLFSYKSGAVRCFPLDECRTGKEFFDKARIFFQLFDKNAEVKILSCQIQSQPLQQYVFEGSEGEFTLLVDQAKSLTRDELVIVEVSHVLSLSPH